jgi:ribosome-associated heat shock protein Hsp15
MTTRREHGRQGEADDGDGPQDGEDALRLDRWLWCVRLYKSRSLATAAVGGGHVHLNGARVKPARAVKPGDRLTVSQGGRELELTVRAIPERRGPAPEARACYEESADSIARGERLGEARRLAALTTPRPDGRPDKKERRDLLAFARRQGRR